MDTESIQGAITAPLPPCVPGLPHYVAPGQTPATDDEQLSEASFLNNLYQQQVVFLHYCTGGGYCNGFTLFSKRVLFEHTCASARWALMHRFLSVCLSVCLSDVT